MCVQEFIFASHKLFTVQYLNPYAVKQLLKLLLSCNYGNKVLPFDFIFELNELLFYFFILAQSKIGMDHLVSMDAKDNAMKLILIVIFLYMDPFACLFINEELYRNEPIISLLVVLIELM